MRIAVVGAGISGLVVAQRLCRMHAVTVFEANDYIGGHTNTVDVTVAGQTLAIDTGFIVFNETTYPHFCRLLAELQVESQCTDMSFSVRDDGDALEYNGSSLNTLFANRRNLVRPSFYRLLADVLRFNREAPRVLNEIADSMTVEEFLVRYRYSQAFAKQYLLPMGSAVWSCPMGAFAQFPIRFIIDFYQNHGLLKVFNRPIWRVIRGGSRNYIPPLVRHFRDRIRLRTPVLRVRRFSDRVELDTPNAPPDTFDWVVFACHSDQALRMLGDSATKDERDVLSAFPYQRNEAILHTDTTILPRARRAWASWNYRIRGGANSPACLTYNMNLLQSIQAPQTLCVTLNAEELISPECILRRFVYHHPVYNTQRAAMQARHAELLTVNRTSYCGAYWRNGFHEDGVVSALRVVEALTPTRTTLRSSPVVDSSGQILGATP